MKVREVLLHYCSGKCNMTWFSDAKEKCKRSWFITGQDSVTPHGSWRQGKCKMIWLTDAKECKKSWFIDTYWRSGHSKMIWLTDAKESVRGHGLLTPRKLQEFMTYPRSGECKMTWFTDAKKSQICCGVTITTRKSPRRNDLKKNDCWLGKCNK